MATQVGAQEARAPRSGVDAVPSGDQVPIFVIDGRVHWRRWWADLFEYRGALKSLMWRNLRSRYKQAALGLLWAFLQPALQVGVFTVLFGVLAKIPTGDIPYPLFALAGLLPWNLFAKIVSEGTQSLVVNQQLVTKLFFPRIYLVLAVGASAVLDAAVTLLLLIGLMLFYHVSPNSHVVLALPAMVGVMLLAYGVGALLAAINARWRDVQHVVPFALQVAIFTTPVIYKTTLVPERWRWLLALNPMTGLIEVLRAAVLRAPMPEPRVLLLSFTSGVVAVVLGFWMFTRAESTVVDVA